MIKISVQVEHGGKLKDQLQIMFCKMSSTVFGFSSHENVTLLWCCNIMFRSILSVGDLGGS